MGLKKKPKEPPPGAPLWMTSYGDMVTQILIFFVMLFTFSSIDAARFKELAISLQSAFKGGVGVLEGGQSITVETLGPARANLAQLTEAMNQIMNVVESSGLKGAVETSIDERGLVISIKDSTFFDLGKADLKPRSIEILNKIGVTLKDLPNQIRVEGHTDNLPINTPQFPSNWELSTARATTVVRYLVEKVGLSPNKMSAAGYGEFRPLYPNDTEEHRARNRRVDIVVLLEEASKGEPFIIPVEEKK
ncbi:TPA: OmpA family protein [bacterium]|jgi:chemotaxis protein MotB|nr:OmpA family protein [bacterium]